MFEIIQLTISLLTVVIPVILDCLRRSQKKNKKSYSIPPSDVKNIRKLARTAKRERKRWKRGTGKRAE
jgi:hypothetical protein